MQYPDIRNLIDGSLDPLQASGRVVLNPGTGEELAPIPDITASAMERALATAWRGFVGWRATPAYQRAEILKKAAGLMRARADDLARIITLEQGKPLSESRGEMFGTAAIFEWLADEACRISSEILASRIPGMRQVIRHEPIGPVLAIAPWNMPAMMTGRKIAHALASGCSVVVKPASETPGIAMELARVLLDAGLPPAAIAIIHGNSALIAESMIAAPEIRKVSFTGSTEVGRFLGTLCGRHIKKFTAELGGHAPVIVFGDADIGPTARMLAAGKYLNAGQSCMAPTRFFVHAEICAEFTGAFISEASRIKVGYGLEPGVGMGAMINARAVRKMTDFCSDALARGGEIPLGGHEVDSKGSFFAPTVITSVPDSARIMFEEPYGPLAPIQAFKEPAEAIARANSLPYGLCAYVFGRDLALTENAASEVEAGLVGINTLNVGGPMVPFGGVKDSGLGREGSRLGLLEHMSTKTIARM